MSEANATDPKRCAATRKDGQPCTVRVLGNGRYCWAHDPNQAQARDQARRRGGLSKANHRRLVKLMPDRLRPVFDTLATALADVLEGSLDPKRATAAAALARALVAALIAGEFEERLRRVEDREGQSRGA